MKIYFVTGNENKYLEVKAILHDFDVEQLKTDVPELQGEPENISLEKAKIACEKTGKAVCVEDTSLVFNAWNGLPGPYIRHFLDKLDVEGLYNMLEPYEDKSAYVETIVGYCAPGKQPITFRGSINGTIVPPSPDPIGFRFDRIFVPEGHDRRFSEMTKDEKNKISYRQIAFNEFAKWLRKNHSHTF